ncbi:MAG: SusC/RagA family TonB-linked outer membrane protein [Lacibacter sp.]
MRLTTIFIFLASLSVSAGGYSQNVSISEKNVSLVKVFKIIEEQTGYDFFYDVSVMEKSKNVSIKVSNVPIEEALSICFRGQPLTYIILSKTIVIKSTAESKVALPDFNIPPPQITVRVVDSIGNPLNGATVSNKTKKKSVVTNAKGIAVLNADEGDELEVSYVGYLSYSIKVTSKFANSTVDIMLKPSYAAMSHVVISSGLVNRRAESFTGAATTVTREELLRAGNQNVLQSLKNIDPTFRIVENLSLGSDPNNMPEVILRGKSSMPDLNGSYSGTNPNQPLFILDGFEVTIQRIYDLDMNRVKSITLLKDAAAKAIYGSKAGNGVVVIETNQPQSGKMKVSYTGNLNIEAPDLTGYNLMNASEKLRWEKEHSMYYAGYTPTSNNLDILYNQRYQDVHTRGVNTYWLSKPLQLGIGQKHNLMLEGGDTLMRYGASFFYNNIEGAMKGSSRKTYGVNVNLSYRYKTLNFKNQIDVQQNNSNNSPYGSFSSYVSMNPYFQVDSAGGFKKILGDATAIYNANWDLVNNPLYNASLPIIDRSKYVQVSDNFFLEWRILPSLRFTSGIGYTYQKNGSDYFLPPSHTNFINYTESNGLINYKGNWTASDGSSSSIESNIGINYNLSRHKHFFFVNSTLNISDMKAQSRTVLAEGFGSDNISDISMASYYQRSGSPSGSDNHIRSIGVVGIANYAYDNRFLLDASYRTSASSIYAANSRWGNFWSLGAGWNIHNERGFHLDNIFQQLKLRGSFGYTGSQNVDGFSSLATYNYVSTSYTGVKGVVLRALPNTSLGWQKNLDYNIGLDFAILNNRLSGRVELYKKITTNMVTSMTTPPSAGFTSYIANLGKIVNTGYEFALRYQVYNNAAKRAFVNLSVTGTQNINRLKDIGDAFKSYNDEQNKTVSNTNQLYTKPVSRYINGQSLTSIWAMHSLGIDPASGNELFLTKDGQRTYTWNADDLIIAGDSEPKINGTVSVNGGYKGFILSLTCSYRFGGKLYNSTLVERLENVDGRSNLDKRILSAWTKEGDISLYKKPQARSGAAVSTVTYTKPTTRFIQNNDEIYFSTINISYDVNSRKVLSAIGFERLRATFYTNELLRISSIKVERGTSYPFARNFSFSLQATF